MGASGTSPSGRRFPLGRRAFDDWAKTRIVDLELTRTDAVTSSQDVTPNRPLALDGIQPHSHSVVARALRVLACAEDESRKGDSGSLMQPVAPHLG